ncbi:MAG: hypothetical protein AAF492_16055, partial [Verrucomicrobiota bacterium]
DFEDGTMEGWTVGGRKDAQAKVLSSRGLFDALAGNRRFINDGGWDHNPIAPALKRGENRFLLQMTSSGPITASHTSHVSIEAGWSYTVSLVGQSRNGGPKEYLLHIDGVDEEGTRIRLGSDQRFIASDEVFVQSVTFSAEAGQPHIGRRLVLSAHYPGHNLIDNARISVNPIQPSPLDRVVAQLPLINTLNDNGTARFTLRGYDDVQTTKPVDAAGTFDNVGAPFTAGAQFMARGHPEYTFYDLDGLVLNHGETAALTLNLNGARAYGGFAVDDRTFLLGRHGNRGKKRDDGTNMNPFRTPDHMMYIARVSPSLGPETILISRQGDRIDWYACGRKGHYRLPGLGPSPRLSLFARGAVSMSRLRKGILTEEGSALVRAFVPAPRHPYGRPNSPGFPGIRQKDDRAFAMALSTDLSQPLADEEIEAMLAYMARFNPHGFGTRADPLFSLPHWAVPANIFLITRRKEALDHLLRIADSAILIRNGFEADGIRYGVRFGGRYNRYVNLHDYCIFPEGGFTSEADQDGRFFNERHEYVNNTISHSSDPANARMITPSLAAYCISLHPELWDQPTADDPCKLGTTYRERAERYVKELALNYT